MQPKTAARKLDSSVNEQMVHDAGGLLDTAAACAVLGIKPASLYAYVSRGLVRSVRTGGRKQRFYVEDDVRRLATRSAARRGHAPVAAGALRWGEPVLASAITSVEGGVLAYRGVPVGVLVERGAGFEAVAELLWQAPAGAWPVVPVTAGAGGGRGGRHGSASAGARGDRRATAASGVDHPLWRMIAALPALAARDPERAAARGAAEIPRARALIAAVAAAAGARPAAGSLAAALARANGADATADAIAAVDAALVACADHELNASTFAARIAAGAGADLYAALGAALCTFTGARHGGAPELVDRLLEQIPPRAVRATIVDALGHGEHPPGFGHRLYPAGDPRVPLILARIPRPRAAAAARRLAHALAAADVVTELTGELPSLDFALVALARGLGQPAAWASSVFALGRTAGWIAHVLEQREGGELLRPRARYVGIPVAS